MHCGLCGDMSVEVRPINIGSHDLQPIAEHLNKDYAKGDYYACRTCGQALPLL